jgi:GT2 family glycosyltransferase
MSTTALLSVVIPTRSAPPSLARALECLAHQTLPPSDYEVIVVGGVTEAEIWQIVPADITYRVRVFSRPGPSPGLRRNAGAAEAHTNLVLFLDDDMAPEPDLLEAHYQAHVGGDGNRVVIGYLPPTHAIGAKGRSVDWFKAHLRDWWEDVFEEMVRPGHRFCHTDVLSGNLSLPTALFRDVGGFVIPSACREDYELGVRLLQAGAEIIFCPTARSLHEDKTDEKRIIQRKIDEGKADVILARLYPELRSTLVFSSQFFFGRVACCAFWRVFGWMGAIAWWRCWRRC